MRPSGSQSTQNGKDAVGAGKMTSLPSFGIDGDDLLRAPIGDPQAAVAPARRFAEREAAQHDPRFLG